MASLAFDFFQGIEHLLGLFEVAQPDRKLVLLAKHGLFDDGVDVVGEGDEGRRAVVGLAGANIGNVELLQGGISSRS